MSSAATTPHTFAGTDLAVHPLCLGGNVFGWTADERDSFEVLDAYADAGGNFIDTADVYMAKVEGKSGGESERMIGRWLERRGNRDQIVVATKVGKLPGLDGLSPATVGTAVERSLERLGVDCVDLLYAHADDASTPIEDTLGAFGTLIEAGKVRYVAASNFSAERLGESLRVAEREGLPRYVALQPLYNVMERPAYEDALRAVCEREGLACLPYYGLASGFLTGKFRGGSDAVDTKRGGPRQDYSGERGERVLDALDDLASAHEVRPAAVALAWLRA
ncbi:MAG: aldo/keto reductase, partial [Solirubrobacterales bacterium]|nr:aldo/keto reductase [Solirubrobacterales bacterium]